MQTIHDYAAASWWAGCLGSRARRLLQLSAAGGVKEHTNPQHTRSRCLDRELTHLAYVQEVAEHQRIPWLGRDHVSWQELALEAHVYPRHSALNPRLLGVSGSSYEAWQPPLYYVLAAPAFSIPSDYRDKVFATRAFDLLLLLATVAILALLARAVFEERWPVPYCLALSTILWPGVIVRAITVSNAALELPLVALYVLVLWNATARPRARSLVAASGLLGLCVLTQLTLFALFTAWAWRQIGMGEKSLLGIATLSTSVVALIWLYLAGAHYFTNVGAAFGIHAAR